MTHPSSSARPDAALALDVLAFFGDVEHAVPLFRFALLNAISHASAEDANKLQQVYPAEVVAMRMAKNVDDGIERLREIAYNTPSNVIALHGGQR